jgi:hypothetical protein
MLKQPHFERRETIEDGIVVQVTITDYGSRRRLSLDLTNKVARPADLNNSFEVEPETGQVSLTKLDMSVRDRLLSLQSSAVEDLGEVEMAGRKVQLMQSSEDGRVVKVWVDPQARQPIQISISHSGQDLVYSSIKIDEPLPDDLFRLEPPDEYQAIPPSVTTKRVGQLFAKFRFLLRECWKYAMEHDQAFPPQLTDLDLPDHILQNLLTIDGGGRLEYVRPKMGGDLARTVVLFEAYETWPEQGIVVGFGDGHAELISNEEKFKQLLGGQPQ